MSDRYPFTEDRTFTHNAAIWNDQVAVQSTLDFSNVSDATLTDSINDSYATAVDENETQYLSVLETSNDITLEDLHNLTLENSKMVAQESLQFSNTNPPDNLEANGGEVNDQQVIVFSVDGSDELYGIQFAQDEEGNMRKYQFKFRTTEDGQLEAIPESIQLLTNDIEINQTDKEAVSETAEDDESEVTETRVIYQDDSNEPAAPVFEQHRNEPAEEDVEREDGEQSCENMQMLIKGEPEVQEEQGVDDADSEGLFEDQLTSVELGEDQEVRYGDSEEEVHLEQRFTDEENIDVKPGILENTSSTNIKEEMLQEDSQDAGASDHHEDDYEMYSHQVDVKPTAYQSEESEEEIPITEYQAHVEVENGYLEVDEAHETVLEYEHYNPDIQQVYEETDTNDSQNLQDATGESRFNPVFIKGNAFRKLARTKQSRTLHREDEDHEAYYADAGTENDSDNDDYQIVEGLHVTAEGDIDPPASPPYQQSDTILQEVPKKPSLVTERANILKQPSLVKIAKELKTKNSKTFVYYVVPHVEKENVNSVPVNYATNTTACRPIRSNPRSILKSSFPEMKEEVEVRPVVDERFSKRFARSKEAVQARLFNNFISKTTIPHAPVRQTRLPRKQQIKPVDNRRDEEIIVQEVLVGYNGFIENMEENLKNKDKLEVTQYVVLSDSDEDYDPKKCNKRKRKHTKYKKSDMNDTEDSDISVIEIPSDDEDTRTDFPENHKRGRGRPRKSTEAAEPTDCAKRRRGRPPKFGHSHIDIEESPKKKGKLESDQVENDSTKKEFECPHCTKSFPSQNSLSTHLHHHSLENSLRNSQAGKLAAGRANAFEYKHRCETCQATFKNSILLQRHECRSEKKTARRVECAVCKKTFPDTVALNVHKRSHVKENLFNTTAVAKVSPKKPISKRSSSPSRIPRKSTLDTTRKSTLAATSKSTVKPTFKCKECTRVCFSQESLDLHEKTHRKYPCASCGSTFPSRLLLDTHVRVSCVKGSPKLTRRPSFKIRKSFVQSPRRVSGRFTKKRLAPAAPNDRTSNANSSMWSVKLECEHCTAKFTTFNEYFKHQVRKHGVETPDKTILEEPKKLLHKPKTLHGGIPAREGMRKVFADVRSKMALITPKKDSE